MILFFFFLYSLQNVSITSTSDLFLLTPVLFSHGFTYLCAKSVFFITSFLLIAFSFLSQICGLPTHITMRMRYNKEGCFVCGGISICQKYGDRLGIKPFFTAKKNCDLRVSCWAAAKRQTC